MFVYSIFDDNPFSNPDGLLPDLEDVEINCRTPDAALDAAIKTARARGRTCGGYRPDETLYAVVWNLDGEMVKSGSVTLGGPGRPAAVWRGPMAAHPKYVRIVNPGT